MPKQQTTNEEAVDETKLTALSAALEALAEEDKVDDGVLEAVESTLSGLNENTQRAVLNLPAIQRLIEKAQEQDTREVPPGTIIGSGLTAYKKPWTLNDIYALGIEERYVYNKWMPHETPIVFGGFNFYLTDGVIYDQPRSVAPQDLPEGHGYQLPKIVIEILETARNQRRAATRETERKPFGMGVNFLETGWGGKDLAIGAPIDPDKVVDAE